MSKYDEDYQVMKALYLEYFRKLEKENEELKKENQSLKKENAFLYEFVLSTFNCEICSEDAEIICEIDNGMYYYFCSDNCKNTHLHNVKITYEHRRTN